MAILMMMMQNGGGVNNDKMTKITTMKLSPRLICTNSDFRGATKKTFIVGKLSQMWIGGVADSQTDQKKNKSH